MSEILLLLRRIVIAAIIFAIVATLVLNINGYFDPISMCHIQIKTVLFDSTSVIRKAIKKIKNDSPSDYATLCNYVSVISERTCKLGDPRVDPSYSTITSDGCFIRGTKYVYLNPSRDISSVEVDKKATLLKKYSRMSLNFWGTSKY